MTDVERLLRHVGRQSAVEQRDRQIAKLHARVEQLCRP
jgi:hypothetical protein